MGIKKLNKFLSERNLVNVYDNIGHYIKEKKHEYNTNGNIIVAIDLLLYLYKYSYAYDSFIIGFWNQISYLLSHRIIPLYVIDNKYPTEKSSTIKSRNRKKESLERRLDTIKQQLENVKKELNINEKILEFLNTEKEKLEKRIIKIKKNDIDLIKEFFTDLNIPFVEARSEADMLCAKLYKEGYIVSCLSDDMDLLCFGCSSLIKFSNSKIIEFSLSKILHGLSLTREQFIEMCIMFGCDYLKPNFKLDVDDIYKNMKRYGSVKNILAKNIYPAFYEERSKYFVEKYLDIKELYMNVTEQIEINMPSIDVELPNEKIIQYIIDHKDEKMSQIEMANILKCINYINNHVNNRLLYNSVSFRYFKKYR